MKDHVLNSNFSVELLKELHILTVDGKINQDSRRKLKQIQHLYQFIEPIMAEVIEKQGHVKLIDHGAGKSYLGFIIYDLFARHKNLENSCQFFNIESRPELIEKSTLLAQKLKFNNMQFLNLTVDQSIDSNKVPQKVDIVTALHACDTATDDALRFAILRDVPHIVVVPCCQAEVASALKANKKKMIHQPLVELFRHPIHTREFGSHLTNVLRCLQLEAFGYQVTVTELVGFEHSMKNELIIAKKIESYRPRPAEKLTKMLHDFCLSQDLTERFFLPSKF